MDLTAAQNYTKAVIELEKLASIHGPEILSDDMTVEFAESKATKFSQTVLSLPSYDDQRPWLWMELGAWTRISQLIEIIREYDHRHGKLLREATVMEISHGTQ
jgi:hypothetical protein